MIQDTEEERRKEFYTQRKKELKEYCSQLSQEQIIYLKSINFNIITDPEKFDENQFPYCILSQKIPFELKYQEFKSLGGFTPHLKHNSLEELAGLIEETLIKKEQKHLENPSLYEDIFPTSQKTLNLFIPDPDLNPIGDILKQRYN